MLRRVRNVVIVLRNEPAAWYCVLVVFLGCSLARYVMSNPYHCSFNVCSNVFPEPFQWS